MKRTTTIVFLIFLFLMSGCALINEGTRGLLGISTKSLEEARKDAAIQPFQCDYQTCYNKTIEVLKQIDAYIYAQDKKKNLIAVYVSEGDTTPVGLFFKVVDENNTQIEVSSPSAYAKEYIATKVFSRLAIALIPLKEEKQKTEPQQK